MICNRTVEKAERLAEHFGGAGIPVYACGFEDLRGEFDLVINAISSGLHGELPPLPDRLFTARGCAYDMLYGSSPPPFVSWAERRALRTSDGLGMLVEQAAESWFIWRQSRPDTTRVLRELRKQTG
jgi:shikimate dehydrogenase